MNKRQRNFLGSGIISMTVSVLNQADHPITSIVFFAVGCILLLSFTAAE